LENKDVKILFNSFTACCTHRKKTVIESDRCHNGSTSIKCVENNCDKWNFNGFTVAQETHVHCTKTMTVDETVFQAEESICLKRKQLAKKLSKMQTKSE